MVGLVVFAAFIGYVAASWFLIRGLSKLWQKVAAIAVAVALPLWELPFAYWTYQDKCASEGGVRLHASFPSTRTLFVDSSIAYNPQHLIRMGLHVVEYGDRNTGFIRLANQAGRLIQTKEKTPISEFEIRFDGNRELPWSLVVSQTSVVRIPGNAVVATHKMISWRGLWWQRIAAPMLGHGWRCFPPVDTPLVAALINGNGR